MISTLKSSGKFEHEFLNPHVVKVVTDRDGYALYFSFSHSLFLQRGNAFFKHIGLYVYARSFCSGCLNSRNRFWKVRRVGATAVLRKRFQNQSSSLRIRIHGRTLRRLGEGEPTLRMEQVL